MEVLTEIDEAANLRRHEIRGTVRVRKLIEYLSGLYDSSQYRSDMNSLWDLRKADASSVTSEEVRALRDGGADRLGLLLLGNHRVVCSLLISPPLSRK